MLDPKRVRQFPDEIKQGLRNRGYSEKSFEAYIEVDKKWREGRQALDTLLHQRSEALPKSKPTPEQLTQLKEISDLIKIKQEEVNSVEAQVKALALEIPNSPHPEVPIGKDEQDNVVLREWGKPPTFVEEPKSHEALGQALGLLDFESAAMVTGARFVIYKGLGAKLERAMINFMVDLHTNEHGYEEVLPPAIVHTRSLLGTGQLPKFSEDCFKIEDSEYWLSPTGEVQLTNMYRDQIIEEALLPINRVTHTPCFRREAGASGRDMKGIIRLHQFNKVELVKLVKPEDTQAELERLLGHAEAVLQQLELPYRVVSLCTGDLGYAAEKTYDIEVWFPSQNRYREISSCSSFFDFQSRRAMIRYRSQSTGEVNYLATLNGSGLAVGRTVAAVMENYQDEGSINIPLKLQPYLGMEKISCQTMKK